MGPNRGRNGVEENLKFSDAESSAGNMNLKTMRKSRREEFTDAELGCKLTGREWGFLFCREYILC
jgi:hypothetical protein